MSLIVKLLLTNLIILALTSFFGLVVNNDKYLLHFKIVATIEGLLFISLLLIGVWGNYFV